ncbi:DUF3325 domain-containing protein [Bordetella avium]|uniref:DUF3325 domain-containing protein n=1 Tax=Bordetella avium TaxID=521 RepID=UPI000E0BDB61|nr:DUF3325 domain-containing protein [Bordetella avium]AZY52080.1 DUF3325 domain-containing protein [Bordetella avium]RIQ14007.1 DUF3325 family protein [Bordetella avium]RIQ16918.1 DUF3325 family protein [Bordetella avium]RIQ36356.1 DUF3325 family protein [Bordetella avium]RIQ39706.1 DUF3325 family protein [Bordetella avium]
MSVAAFFLAYAGFAALSLAMERHFEDVFDRPPPPALQRWLRTGGTLALAASLWLCARVSGWSYGIVLWTGLLTVAGLLLIGIMTYRPRLAWATGAACLALSPLLSMLSA